ncbi:MAG: DUF1634 domain-containing protein [Desulfomonilaceae bacterium]
MMNDTEASLNARPEQVVYANILEKGMLLGLVLVVVTYALYVSGVIKPFVSMEVIVGSWTVNVHDYLHKLHIEPGWAWLFMLGYGDFLNFVGIALLAGVTIVCFLAVIPVLLKQGDRLYALLAFLEVAILSLAASGLLGTGGH